MKKFLPAFFLMACLVAAFAQSPKTDYTKEGADGTALWSFDNGVFTFNSTYVWTDFAARIDYKASGSAAKSSVKMTDLVEFGYYKIVDGQAGDAVTMFKLNATTGEMEVKNSVIFNGGDKIGIYAKINNTNGHWEYRKHQKIYTSDSKDGYMKDGKWVTYHQWDGVEQKWVPESSNNGLATWTTTPNAIEGALTNTNNVDHDSIGKETQYFCLFLQDFKIRDHFEYYLAHVVTGDNYDDFISDVITQNTDEHGNPISNITDSDGKPVTTGQPLPGLFLTLACGGAATGLCTRKRKRSAKA